MGHKKKKTHDHAAFVRRVTRRMLVSRMCIGISSSTMHSRNSNPSLVHLLISPSLNNGKLMFIRTSGSFNLANRLINSVSIRKFSRQLALMYSHSQALHDRKWLARGWEIFSRSDFLLIIEDKLRFPNYEISTWDIKMIFDKINWQMKRVAIASLWRTY